MNRGRKIRKLEIERLLGRQLWNANELSEVVHISPLNMRRYFRRYRASGRLVRKKFGIVWYYGVKRFLSPPNFSYPCPQCQARMDVYILPCGCNFQLCGVNRLHDIWKYCEKHKGSIPRFEKVEASCAICGKKEVVKIDRKENKILAEWVYYGRICPPGKSDKIEYWECKPCIKAAEMLDS